MPSIKTEIGLVAGVLVGAYCLDRVRVKPDLPAPVLPATVSLRDFPQRPLTLGGYQEDAVFTNFDTLQKYWDLDAWVVYRNRKKGLDKAREVCRQHAPACLPVVQTLNHVMTQIDLLSGQKRKAMAINAFVNLAIAYDFPEAKQDKRRDLVKTLQDGAGVCEEQAQLKLYLLEAAGFNKDDVRYVGEAITEKNKPIIYHAVVEVRINGGNWILNNQSPLHMASRAQLLSWASTMERDSVHLNAHNESSIGSSAWRHFPLRSFNYSEIGIYPVNNQDGPFAPAPPIATLPNSPDFLALHRNTMRQSQGGPVDAIAIAAFGFHYSVRTMAANPRHMPALRASRTRRQAITQSGPLL